ncbi:hypothetical protein lerEdw1_010950 [Lerista edwardsae]|nr:hypothetical protein lerEdw1_010950 [Lerista edwardsae]
MSATLSSLASAAPLTVVEQQAMCRICQACLQDPVTLGCRHNFGRECITTSCATWEEVGYWACPICKAQIQVGALLTNWQLSSTVEHLKRHPPKSAKESMCAIHEKELNLFCKRDLELACVACERSPEHRAHPILLIEDAAQKYKSSGL